MKFIDKRTYKRKMMLLTFVLISIGGILLYSYQSVRLKNSLESEIAYISSLIHKDFDTHIVETKKEYSLKVDRLLKIDGVREAFASKDREKLYELVSKKYEEQIVLDPYLKIVTFRLDDGSAWADESEEFYEMCKLSKHSHPALAVEKRLAAEERDEHSN